MELEALAEIHADALGGQIVVITPELERYTRFLHKKLQLTFDILTDLHLKIAEQFRLVFSCRITCRSSTGRLGTLWTDSTMSRNTDCLCPHATNRFQKHHPGSRRQCWLHDSIRAVGNGQAVEGTAALRLCSMKRGHDSHHGWQRTCYSELTGISKRRKANEHRPSSPSTSGGTDCCCAWRTEVVWLVRRRGT